MDSLPDAKSLLAAAAAELHRHPAVLACVILAVAVLIYRMMILSLGFLAARRSAAGEPGLLLHPARTVEAAAAPPSSAPRSPLAHFAVLCVAVGTVLHAEPLVRASAELGLGPAVAVYGVLTGAALFNWAIVRLNHLVAHRPAERDPKKTTTTTLLQLRRNAPAASTACPSSPAFAVLAALVSASWFVEPFAAAAELRLPRAAVVITVVLFAALFNLSVHSFRSFLLRRRPPAAAAQWEGPGMIAVAVMSVGVAAASAYVPAPARG